MKIHFSSPTAPSLFHLMLFSYRTAATEHFLFPSLNPTYVWHNIIAPPPSVWKTRTRGTHRGAHEPLNCFWFHHICLISRSQKTTCPPLHLGSGATIPGKDNILFKIIKKTRLIHALCLLRRGLSHLMNCWCVAGFNSAAPVLPVIIPFKCWSGMPLPQQSRQSRGKPRDRVGCKRH